MVSLERAYLDGPLDPVRDLVADRPRRRGILVVDEVREVLERRRFAPERPGLKDSVAERPNHSNLCSPEFDQNSVKIQENYQKCSEILKNLGLLNIF